MAITQQQIDDLRSDLGDAGSVFTVQEYERIWDRVSGAKTTALQYEAALALCIRQLLTNAAKLHDYTAAGDSNRESQVWDHLKMLYELYRPSLDSALGSQTAVVKGILRKYPHQTRESPDA